MRRLLLAFSAILVGLLACARNVPSAPAVPGGDSPRRLTHAGLERSYMLHVPPGMDGTQPTAVVLVFHGGGGDGEQVARSTAFSAQADRSGFLAVYPNGTGRLGDKLLTWNAGTCCAYAREHNVDDVGFVRAIIADLQSIADIDTKRIYATGMSNGAIMSYRLACEASDLIAAIGPVSGTQNIAPCEPKEPVSVIHFHGTSDQHVPYAGGVGDASLTDVDFASVQDSLRFWLDYDRCPSTPRNDDFADVQHSAYTGCAQGSAVELYTIVGGAHAWPGSSGPGRVGGDQPTTSISATQLIWEFFAAHPKP